MQTVAVAGERLVETAHIRRAWDTLRSGHRALLLLGSVGGGKTSCLLHLAERRRRAGAKVATWPSSTVPPSGLLIVDDAHLLSFADVTTVLRSAVDAGGEVVFAARPSVPWRDDFLAADLGIQVDVDVLGTWDLPDISAVAGSQLNVEQLARLDVGTLRHQTGGLAWLVSAALRDLATAQEGDASSVAGDVIHAWQQLPESEGAMALALACGYGVTEPPVAPILRDIATPQAVALADRLLCAGLLEPAGGLPPLVRSTLLVEAPRHHVTALVAGVLDELDELGSGFDRLPDEVLALSERQPRLAEAALARGDADLAQHPRRALAWYAAAQPAGDPVDVTARRVVALGILGDIPEALAALAALPPTDDPHLQGLASMLATLAGQYDQAATLGSLLDSTESMPDAVAVAQSLYAAAAVGDLAALRETMARMSQVPTPLVPGAFEELATVVATALVNGEDALAGLVRLAQAGLPPQHSAFYPDDSVAVAALVAVQSGDLALADAVLAADVRDRRGGRPTAQRIECARAWVAMARGRYTQAQRLTDALDPRIGRDRIWILALRLGLARRQDDLPALTRLWDEARSTVIGLMPGLFDLLPLGEIHLAAARMREPAASRQVWNAARALVDGLGQPPSFAPLFHWYGIQAAITAENPSELVPHARALAALAGRNAFAATLAAAGRAWLAVLTGDADVQDVVDASRGLGRKGLAWDGARLAAHGAARSTDARAPSMLLEVARDLQPRPPAPDRPSAQARQVPQQLGRIELSPREREVAELVLQGLTYKVIGQRLYLSAKTIEHHMARIKRRSNATSRQELLARLSVTLSPD